MLKHSQCGLLTPFTFERRLPTISSFRPQQRDKTGYTSFSPSDLDDVLRSTTSRIGLWIDSSSHTIDETVDVILKRQSEAVLL